MKDKKQIFKNIVNLILLLLSLELINIIISEIPGFSNIDLRLISIFIIAISMGMKYGIIAAIASSVFYILQVTPNLSDISIIFLNTNNWLQIVIYLVFAIIIGLKHDKDKLKVETLKDARDDLKEKEKSNDKKIEVYEKELKEFNQVLLTHKQTYIQVAEFIKKIESAKEDYTRINVLLKEVLDNDNCELTTFQSINTFLNPEKIEILDKEHIWVNRNLEKEQPMFIVPISIVEKEMAMVIWKCRFEQINMDYQNQIIGVANIIKYVLTH